MKKTIDKIQQNRNSVLIKALNLVIGETEASRADESEAKKLEEVLKLNSYHTTAQGPAGGDSPLQWRQTGSD